jgi:tripartite-type tricarboxylate transporter receptor subunit TctC
MRHKIQGLFGPGHLGRRFLLAGGLLLGSSVAALGQDEWSARPVIISVGYPAGSASDMLARTLTDPLARKFGRPFIIENRTGADGMISGRAVARSSLIKFEAGLVRIQSTPLRSARARFANQKQHRENSDEAITERDASGLARR